MSDISEAYNDRCHAAMTRYSATMSDAFARMNAAFSEQEAELAAAQKEFHDRTAERLRQFNGEPAQEPPPPPPPPRMPPPPPSARMPPAPDLSEIERDILANRAAQAGPTAARDAYDAAVVAFGERIARAASTE